VTRDVTLLAVPAADGGTTMKMDEYIHAKQDELKAWEHSIESKGLAMSEGLSAKRDEMIRKLDALKHDTNDRWDVVRMGFESAWAELKTAYDTVTAKDLNAKS
jgi:hypothetical protein